MTKNTKRYSINQLESIISSKWKISNEDAEIQYIAQDSRKIIDPESTLFFAMRGGRLDGHHIGINTVGQSLRNANRQLRSEPPNPQVKVSPWNQTTIEADTNRRPMEIGS